MIKMNEYLDYINDVKNDIKYFEQMKKMYQYTHLNNPELTEEMADYVEGQLIMCYEQIKDSKEKLNQLYEMGNDQMETMEIMQWGEKRSVVYCVNTESGEAKILLIDNDYLIFLDELGVFQ